MYLKASALKQPRGIIWHSDCHVRLCRSDKGWTGFDRDTPGGGSRCCAEELGRHHKDAYQVKAALSREELGKQCRSLTRLMRRETWTCITAETHWVEADAGEAVCSPGEAVHRLGAAVVPHIHLLPGCGERVSLPVVIDAPALGQRGETCRDVLCSLARPQHSTNCCHGASSCAGVRGQLCAACTTVTAASPEGVFASPLQHWLAVLHDRPTLKGGEGHLQDSDGVSQQVLWRAQTTLYRQQAVSPVYLHVPGSQRLQHVMC